MNRTLDPAGSRAILMGCGSFTRLSRLPNIPAVKNNLTSLAASVAGGPPGAVPASHCQVILDPEYLHEVGRPLALAARDATDLFLVYYSGHGILNEQGQLYLALGETDRDTLPYSALPFDTLRREITNSPAAVRVLILDCCFSGRAIEALADDQAVIEGQLHVAGTYTLSSTTANAPAHAPIGEEYTAFTGALLRALQKPHALTLDEIYKEVDGDLRASGRPRPQRRAVNTAGDIVLSRGPVQRQLTRPVQEVGEERFCRTPEEVLTSWRAKWVLSDLLGTVCSAILSFTTPWWSASTVGLITLLAIALTAMVWNSPLSEPDELVISASGITLTQDNEEKRSFAWHDISAVGVMTPLIPNPAPSGKSTPSPPPLRPGPPVLAVRLRPEVPDPDAPSDLLTRDHNQLGYFGVCPLDAVRAKREDIHAALERFAGTRVVRSAREFLDMDARLRPDMV
ncbi:caspase family protein [Streptomyces sp. NPDC048251]|uniref:caspase family protein n=1 Tax=Streptomyces sp. NPDC048251 TaxID=3154501 RepID=UPI0034433DC8